MTTTPAEPVQDPDQQPILDPDPTGDPDSQPGNPETEPQPA